MATAVGGLSSLASYTSEDDEGDDTNEAAAIRVDTSNAQNGLMGHGGARSISTLGTWLKEHRIQVSDDVEVVDTSDAGWTLRALSDLAEHHVRELKARVSPDAYSMQDPKNRDPIPPYHLAGPPVLYARL